MRLPRPRPIRQERTSVSSRTRWRGPVASALAFCVAVALAPASSAQEGFPANGLRFLGDLNLGVLQVDNNTGFLRTLSFRYVTGIRVHLPDRARGHVVGHIEVFHETAAGRLVGKTYPLSVSTRANGHADVALHSSHPRVVLRLAKHPSTRPEIVSVTQLASRTTVVDINFTSRGKNIVTKTATCPTLIVRATREGAADAQSPSSVC